ncbi:hypothetical protein ACXIU3_24340, partial [Vibrio parahaemolyticus]
VHYKMRAKRHPITAALLAASVLSPAAVRAQATETLPEVKVKASASRELGEGYNPPDTVTATKMDVPLRDVPQTVNVVTAEV